MSRIVPSKSVELVANWFPSRAFRRFMSMLRWDIQVQMRYGLYSIYAIITALYVAGVVAVPAAVRPLAITWVVFSDPVFLGMFFIGALVLFEKGDGVLDALTVSPLGRREYLLSKVLSLTVLATITSLIVAVFGQGLDFDILLFLLGVILSSVLFVLIGFVAVARFDTINAYLLTALLYLLPTVFPLVGFIGIDHPLLYLIPTKATLLLLGGAFGVGGPIVGLELIYAISYLLVWIGLAGVLADRAFKRHIVHGVDVGGGGGSFVSVPEMTRLFDGRRFGPVGMLVISDLRNWFRDPLLTYIFILPFFYAALVRLSVPVIASWLAPGFDLVAYYPLIQAFFAFTPPLTFGFMTGLLVLEEKEENVLAALWTTPLTGRGYVAYRGISMVALSFVSMILVIPVIGLVTVPASVMVSVAAVGSLWAIGTILLISKFSDNTVEGLAVGKFVGFSIMIPVFAILIVPEPYQFLAGLDPVYWPFKALVGGASGVPFQTILGYLVVGVVVNALFIGVFIRQFDPTH
ncbi:fluoroquinolone export ABC transporter permease subunit [Halocatena halophila]|uniref:fluoroquinolone export ABC transporter permease subunit n=1 Tax=Halocatena halophila TaxID=2814576 RepID=UPI002ED32A73